MTIPGHGTLEETLQELACPNCGYALRGLSGPVRTCPECGHDWDVLQLVTRRREDWVKGSEYVRLFRVSVLVAFAAFVTAGMAPFVMRTRISPWTAMAVVPAFVTIWIGLTRPE